MSWSKNEGGNDKAERVKLVNYFVIVVFDKWVYVEYAFVGADCHSGGPFDALYFFPVSFLVLCVCPVKHGKKQTQINAIHTKSRGSSKERQRGWGRESDVELVQQHTQ